jgi:ribosomal protein S18 acetylase RimI-like enzyme
MQTLLPEISRLDSERFGVVAARAEDVTAADVPAMLAFCAEQGVELLIARCDGADRAAQRALSAGGLVALDAQIVYRGPLAPGWDSRLRLAGAHDIDAVARLARDTFDGHVGHYQADPRLDTDVCAEGYVDWALRGLAGEAADVAFLAEVDGEPVGFAIASQKEGEVVVHLAGVAESARGTGLHAGILRHAMAWAEERGAGTMTAVTSHNNVPAQHNFIKVGLRPAASTTTFHGWRDRLGPAR